MRKKKNIFRNINGNIEVRGQMPILRILNSLSPRRKEQDNVAAAAEERIEGLDDPELSDLWRAFNEQKLDTFKKLLPEEKDKRFKLLNSRHEIFQKRPIIFAIHRNWVEMVEYLLKEDVDINSFTDQDEFIPFIEAVRCNNLAIVKLLVEKGANIYEPNFQGTIPIHLAEKVQDKEIYDFLFEISATPVEVQPPQIGQPGNSSSRSQELVTTSSQRAAEQDEVQLRQTGQTLNSLSRSQELATTSSQRAAEQRAFDPDKSIVDITQFFDSDCEVINREKHRIKAIEPKLSPLELHHATIELDWLYIIKKKLGKYNQESKEVLFEKLSVCKSISNKGFTRLVDAYIDHLCSADVVIAPNVDTNFHGRC